MRTILAWKELFREADADDLLGTGLSLLVSDIGGVDLTELLDLISAAAAGEMTVATAVSATVATTAAAAAEVLGGTLAVVVGGGGDGSEAGCGSILFSCLNFNSSLDCDKSWSSSGRSACIFLGSGSITYLTLLPPAVLLGDDDGGGAKLRPALVDGVAGVTSIVLPAPKPLPPVGATLDAPPALLLLLVDVVLEYELELFFT